MTDTNENSIEKDLNPESITDSKQAFYELEKLKWSAVTEYTSKLKDQKTQMTKKERLVLPLLEIIAEVPYGISEKIRYEKSNPFWIPRPKNRKMIEHKLCMPMRVFLDRYYEMGIAVDRLGRLEEKEIFKSLLSNQPQMENIDTNKPQGNILTK